MRRADRTLATAIGLCLLPLGWTLSRWGMTGHMAAHMIAVAIAAPLLAFGLAESWINPARHAPRIVTPMSAMLVELVVVWSWHLPALRRAAHGSPGVNALEQACFLIAGWLLWSAVLHGRHRAPGIGALLLTSMHMTLLGVLVGLASRPLYPGMHHHGDAPFGLDPLADQQLGGVVMLVIGGASYLIGGLALLATLLRSPRSLPA